MTVIDLERAWTDEEYRALLVETDGADVPLNPAGGRLDDFEIRDPKVDPLYNTWLSCWVTFDDGTPDCCAY